ncbi:MAG: transporter substrate-binding domain-containing protein [Treponema sp.]|jgi:signal transduction histidine kinase/FixJ family two-component response regulator/HPt (histidine-containing phosphotransfer) domain-containing protein|nr:transporter substrate-binding domain-containing protein [Treponema sp.]
MGFKKIFLRTSICIAVWVLFSGCAKDGLVPDSAEQFHNSGNGQFPVYTSYREIPGVTPEEIAAIENFHAQGRSFVYGVDNSSECFNDRDGLGGYAVLFCQWLTDLFGLTFTPVIYEWGDLVDGFNGGEIDFTGELTATMQRQQNYFITGPIAERIITVTRGVNSDDPEAIAVRRPPRLGFLRDSATRGLFLSGVSYAFDSVYVNNSREAYRMLREGRLDAFIGEGHDGESAGSEDLVVEDVMPLIYSSVSLAARDAALSPVITVVQKYLEQGALYYLVKLYNQGYSKYLTYRFHSTLTSDELAYVTAHDGSGGPLKTIPLTMEQSNYPVAFYNGAENSWQGMAWDVLEEIENISGLRFEVINGRDTPWADNLALLESGEAAIVSDLFCTEERKDRFLWGSVPYAQDRYALLSKIEMPDIGINEVLYSKVGLVKGIAYTEVFQQWFPNHPYAVEYPGVQEALTALKEGEIDLFMGTRNILLTLTNYMEEPGFKANMVFNWTADSYFGFNRNQQMLCSVIDKAQALVNTGLIEARWLTRVFDYRDKLIRFRQPYLIGFCALLGIAIVLLIALVQKYKGAGKQLETMVKIRTRELEDRSIELEFQKNAAQTAYKVKNRFLANISHEIRTPLNAIIGLSQAEMKKMPEESQESLHTINHSGTSLLGVINDLLDISNIESGEMELRTGEYSLPSLISSAAASAKLRIGSKPIRFRLEVDENLPLKLKGDNQRIRQIISNLVSNAVKFTPRGSVTLRIGFESCDTGTVFLIFEISDTGIGIKARHMEKLFTDYGQADTTSSRSAGGTGMGLLITKKLAEMMEGTVTAESEFGKGSVFTARIRQDLEGTGVLGPETAEQLRTFTWKEAQEETLSLPYARVLVVDDVSTNHAVARGIMKPYGITVDAASSGQEAIDIIGANVQYDAIFMDHMMPEMDGMEAVARIRGLGTEYAKNIPIIALTANALPENEEYFLQNGFNAFMVKPINVTVLNKVLIDWVQDKEKEKLYSGVPQKQEEKAETSRLSDYLIDGVDLGAGAAQFGGEENYLEIVKVFVQDTPKLLENIQNNLSGFRIMPAAAAAALDALKNYTIAVHGIKGSCYGICAVTVGDLAKELELAAKNQDMNKVVALNTRFTQAVEKLVNELKVLFPRTEVKSARKKAPDNGLLQKLLEAARAYDINRMFEALDELEQYSYEENEDLVKQLKEAADNYEYADVVGLLAGFLEGEEELLSGTAG